MHARPVGVEDPHHFDGELVLPPIIEKQRFRAALAFVVTGARSNRVDVVPVFLGLRVDAGTAVNLRRRGLQDFGAQALRQSQHVDGAVYAGLGRLHRVVLVVDRGGRAGQVKSSQVVDLVGFEIERKRHVMPDDFKTMIIEHALDVTTCSGEIIVDADEISALL